MIRRELDTLIAPSFYGLYHDVKRHEHTHYWLSGGRGSTKSSFVSLIIPLGMMAHHDRNAVVFRRYGSYLRDSVFSQIIWALDALGVLHLWRVQKSPMQMVFLPTGQRILFRGMDDPIKSKSIKTENGYFAYIWYEETAEFESMEAIDTVNVSLMRGGDEFWVFYSYNPPKSKNSWVNVESEIPRVDKLVHKSTYRTVPPEWLGEPFLIEAEYVRQHNPAKYDWMYGGKAIGTGGEVFRNVKVREITDDEIRRFDDFRRGLDWGYGHDPFTYIVGNYDKRHRRLYIFFERYSLNVSNQQAAAWVREENVLNQLVYCDSAEPKSIAYLQGEGINALPADKYAGSRTEGYSFMSDDIDEIIIDPSRCPNAAREFVGYELEQDQYGNFKSKYPDCNDHTIDAVHYALNDDIAHVFVPRAGRQHLF